VTSAGEPLGSAEVDTCLRVLRAGLVGSDPTDEHVRSAAGKYLAYLAPEARNQVVAKWITDHVNYEPADVLRGEGGPLPWFAGYDPSHGYHWHRLREYLVAEKGRSETVVDSLDRTTNQILEMLGDPRTGGREEFHVYGLVLGYVQSGKTANFSALIAKAFDAGYRIVIVLSGLHNSLRRQTQLRLEDELGLVPSSPERPSVGRADDDHQITRMTQADVRGDFNQGTADASLLSGGNRTILVMKKNATILRRLNEWLKDLPQITQPVLVIDDEADQASINTRGNRPPNEPADPDEEDTLDQVTDLEPEDVDAAAAAGGIGRVTRAAARDETDPSTINKLIRGLLDQMRRVAYVGYTATPFANVLIGHDNVDAAVGPDLYPRHFIFSLPRPPGYVGADRLFGREALGGEFEPVPRLNVIREVEEWEASALLPRTRDPAPDELPKSLQTAIMDFVLAMAARDVRTGGQPASSMLIHASQLTAQQDILAVMVRDFLAELRQQWLYDLHEGSARTQLRTRWVTEFMPITGTADRGRVTTFDEIEDAVRQILRRGVRVLVLNSNSQDELDYEREPNLRGIVIGGNKLSRGLTLEGLLVSYYVRRANNYDTLLQMGRWFGFREDYIDLTRLYTTSDLADNFRDLATCEEELRLEIRRYEQLNLTPMDFGPRIRKHPTMEITARNRMGAAQSIAYNYSGTLQQTSAFDLHATDWLQHNLDATRRFLAGLGTTGYSAKDDGRRTWTGVDWRAADAFLADYQTYSGSTKFVTDRVRAYLRAQATQHGELLRWTVIVRGLLKRNDELGDEDLGIADGRRVACIARNREIASHTSIGTLVDPVSKGGRGDEDLDLPDAARAAAQEAAGNKPGAYPPALRAQRSPQQGLLLLYPISRFSRPREAAGKPGAQKTAASNKQALFENPSKGVTVIGLAVSLPVSTSPAATQGYVVGDAGPAPA
jgi:Z1 domain